MKNKLEDSTQEFDTEARAETEATKYIETHNAEATKLTTYKVILS